MIVPGICSGAKPEALAVPGCDISRHGFSMEYHIVPKEFEKGKILRIVHKNRRIKTITPKIHYAPIMAHIANVAIEKYGKNVAIPYNPDKVIAKELAMLAPSSAVKKESSQHSVPRQKGEKDSPSLASAAQINNKPLRTSAVKAAKYNKLKITLNQKPISVQYPKTW